MTLSLTLTLTKVRSAYTLHAMYELERWELTPERTGYLSSYKTLLALAIERSAVGRLYPEP